MTQPPANSSEPDWVETLLPLIVTGLIGVVIYTKRATIIGWLAVHHIVICPEQRPLIAFYAGYGLDLQRIILLLIPAVAAVACSVIIAVAVWRNATAPRRPN